LHHWYGRIALFPQTLSVPPADGWLPGPKTNSVEKINMLRKGISPSINRIVSC
jgi:hypothetical protein